MEPHEQLEEELIKTGWTLPHVVACSSGTAALHLALEAIRVDCNQIGVTKAEVNKEERRLGPDSEVITCDYNMIAVPRAITLAGMKPVFVDCNSDNLLLNTNLLEHYITDKTAAILVTHIYGRQVDMKRVHEMADRYHLWVIEDMAELHGIPPHPLSDAACYSFYKNKIVGGEEGGCVTFRNPSLARFARQLRCLGFTENHDFFHMSRGHNYRLAPSLAKLILESLGQFESNFLQRRAIESWLDDSCPLDWKQPARQSPWVYDLRIRLAEDKTPYRVVDNLNRQGLSARHGFKRMTAQVEYYQPSLGLTEAGKAGREVFYLPLDPWRIKSEQYLNNRYDLSKPATWLFDRIRELINNY